VFVKAASAAALPVTIAKEGKEPVSARSILAVLGLDVRGGEQVVLESEGDGAEDVLEDLARLLTEDLEG
jgi:phosphocarrier protein